MKNKTNLILDNIDYILDCEFMIKNLDPLFDKDEITNINKIYNFNILFVIRKNLKSIINFIYNFISLSGNLSSEHILSNVQ